MAKYLQRSCPKCNGYLQIVVPVPAINGCVEVWLSACVGIDRWLRINLYFNSTGETQLLRGGILSLLG